MFLGPTRFTPKTADDRLAAFAHDGLPLAGRVEVLWNEHHVPYILAEHDEDVPLVLGMIHAHLRLGQIELLRRGVRGRLSEMFGPPATKFDQALRSLQVDRAAPEILSALPEASRRWLDRYVEGVNAYIALPIERPPEFGMLDIRDEPWTAEDVVAIGRLVSVDVNWFHALSMLRLRHEPGFDRLMARLRAHAESGTPSFGAAETMPLEVLMGMGRTGSNAFAVGGDRTAAGAAILGSDPHLGLSLPNFWVLVGIRSPGVRVVGLTYPGVPAVLVGRNEHIAWGATNMRSINSTLYDLTDMPEDSIRRRSERVKVRWWFNRDVVLAESDHGPVLSELTALKEMNLPPIALNWRGHEVSDELTPFLKLPRIDNFDDFRRAFTSYAVSGQNFLYADREGNIGQILAVEIEPDRIANAAQGLLTRPSSAASLNAAPLRSVDLPHAYNPQAGYIVTTNNTPFALNPPMVVAGNADDRYVRIRDLIGSVEVFALDDVRRIHTDVYSASAHRVARELAQRLGRAKPEAAQASATSGDADVGELISHISNWDGHYHTDSRGAAAYQLMAHHLGRAHFQAAFSRRIAEYLLGAAVFHDLLYDDLVSGGMDERLAEAARRAAADHRSYSTWGELHSIRLGHILANVPLIGNRFRFGEYPIGGSSTTVMKSAHPITNRPHQLSYGQQSRFMADLADPDQTWAVLLGGQDGWLGSETFLDQWPLWQKGEYIQLPLRESTIRQRFTHRVVLQPGSSSAAFPR
ncbi:MAG: penicillin acylase family protein [Phycisphaeraceae bacterium]|nr:penicillin acylase family protein [Phycisphaeraceae bacterium]